METINDAITKRFGKSLVHLLKVVDPDRNYMVDQLLAVTWDALSLEAQRRMYLYLLYKKWQGHTFYNSPFEIISNCHPYPTNWNGKSIINRLMKEGKMVSAKYDGSYGIYTLDEARVWQMTDVKPLNF